jgi:putative PIN family toxin of toxin-antitoxin system
MRLVLDTNTAISGLLWGGAPGQVIDAAVGQRVVLCSTDPLLEELRGVLHRAKFAKQLAARDLVPMTLWSGYAALIIRVYPEAVPPTVLRDPADDQVLAAALGARAQAIVSGDLDLPELGSFRDIPIITATEAIRRINR